jgi:large subunit ribosomal protein LX
MKAFKVTGTFRNRPGMQAFTKEVAAKGKDEAIEAVMSLMGSKHRAKRAEVKIDTVVEMKQDEITDPVVLQRTKK